MAVMSEYITSLLYLLAICTIQESGGGLLLVP